MLLRFRWLMVGFAFLCASSNAVASNTFFYCAAQHDKSDNSNKWYFSDVFTGEESKRLTYQRAFDAYLGAEYNAPNTDSECFGRSETQLEAKTKMNEHKNELQSNNYEVLDTGWNL